MKKKVLAMMFSAAVLAMAVPACAEVFKTEDEVLSVETPDNEGWAVTPDGKYWFVLTNGSDIITIDHLSNGEAIPPVSIADESYTGIAQSFVSTKNEVFVITGKVTAQGDLPDMISIMNSIKVLKYDTKRAVASAAREQASSSEFSLRSINATYYVNVDSLNVRSGCSTDDQIVGSLSRGDEVKVVGAVTKDGADYGWYQINYQGSAAYVSASLLSSTKTEKSSSGNPKSTGLEFEVWDASGNLQGKLFEKSDYYYYSADGFKYEYVGDQTFKGVDISDTLYSYDPTGGAKQQAPSERAGAFMVWDGYGQSQGYLAPRTDSNYFESNDGMLYRDNGNGSYYGIDTGDTLYSYDPTAGNDDGQTYSHYLTSKDTGAGVYVYSNDANSYEWVDDEGTRYQNNGNGTFTDYYGNGYDLIA